MPDFDAVIVGAGHNALVCAGYLAKAGYHVAVVERRHTVGGAVVTEEIIDGFKFDLGGSAHILIHHTPIVKDLGLARYDLDYIDVDPIFFAPFPDGSHLFIWKDLDKTCESIAQISPRDAETYRAFIKQWQPMAEGMVRTFNSTPSPYNLFKHLILGANFGRNWQEPLNQIIRSYGHFLRNTFESPQLQALIGWMAAQSGPPPGEAFSAPFALWHPLYHQVGIKRPKGGSGMLTQSLAKMITAYGGSIYTDNPVTQIITQNGRAVGVHTQNGQTITGRVVISGAHIHTTMKLLGEGAPPRAKRIIDGTRIGNGFGAVVRYAMNELPDYTAYAGAPNEAHRAMQMICPSLDYLEAAYGDFLAKRPSQDPALISMTFSTVDPTLAPPDHHTMFLWGQYYPYDLANNEQWDAIEEREADNMLATLRQYAPNMTPEKVVGKLIETPVYLERTLGLLQGNVMHLEMSLDQMMAFRPALSMSNYRAPVKGLYLTGASTHPGGGIMGAAGRNAAHVVLNDFARRRI